MMKNMKKLSILLSLALILSVLASCDVVVNVQPPMPTEDESQGIIETEGTHVETAGETDGSTAIEETNAATEESEKDTSGETY